jgi:hypothetical protein
MARVSLISIRLLQFGIMRRHPFNLIRRQFYLPTGAPTYSPHCKHCGRNVRTPIRFAFFRSSVCAWAHLNASATCCQIAVRSIRSGGKLNSLVTANHGDGGFIVRAKKNSTHHCLCFDGSTILTGTLIAPGTFGTSLRFAYRARVVR